MNVLVAVGSEWVAGRDDCKLLRLLAESVEGAGPGSTRGPRD
jgi:hypothetical protein